MQVPIDRKWLQAYIQSPDVQGTLPGLMHITAPSTMVTHVGQRHRLAGASVEQVKSYAGNVPADTALFHPPLIYLYTHAPSFDRMCIYSNLCTSVVLFFKAIKSLHTSSIPETVGVNEGRYMVQCPYTS